MKKTILVAIGLLALAPAWAEDAQDATAFSETSTLTTLLERIPGTSVAVSWLPQTTVLRYDEAQFDKDKSMVEVHRLFGQWCRAKSGQIFWPQENNCTILRNSLGCAVGELQYPGLGSDFERGLKDAAAGSGDTVATGWPKASWLLSRNVLFNLFANKGPNQVAIVGGLQRCIVERNRLLNAMAFVSINGNHDLLFLDERGYDGLAKRGAELSKLATDKQKEEAAQKKAQETARVAALHPGDYVVHTRYDLRGMVIEMKPPLAQIQWEKGYGAKSVEWIRLDELKPEKRGP